ncbi:MAG TPA: hypothetical protein PKW11_01165 [Pseudomonadota bacterium]|nr:hypothetical protein [Pseudomonadota bacterium]
MLAWLAAAAALSFISERDGNREVYVIAADGSGERRITRSGDADYNGPITPDGKYLLVTSVSELQHEKQQRFFLYPTAGGVPKPLGPIRSLLRHPTFSRDGRFLFFEGSSTDLREIFRLQIDGQKLVPITKNREGNFQPCLSPTGDRLAFVSSRDQVAELYVSSPTGGPARRLTQTERDEWQPQFFPDGKWLLFGSDRDGADRLYRQPVDGGTAKRLSPEGLDPFVVEESASISPDGSAVVYVHRQRDRKDKLCLVDVATGKRTTLFESQADPATEPVFSPDGTLVAFTLGLGLHSQIFVVARDGTKPRRLTQAKGPNWHPLWLSRPSAR